MVADLFFDLDRTLWDFDRNSREALARIFSDLEADIWGQEWGVNRPELASIISIYESENAKCWKDYSAGRLSKEVLRSLRFERTLIRLGAPEGKRRKDLAETMGVHYVQISPQLPHLISGAMETLKTLAKRGHRMFILTNGFEEVQHIKVENSGLASFFEAVYTSDALGHKKPHPEAFVSALSAAQVKPENAIMIGDDLVADVMGAQALGIRSVHFNPYDEVHGKEVWRSIRRLEELEELPLFSAHAQATLK